MSYNGSGVFVINTAGQPVVSGTVISSTAFNSLTADLATGLSTALTKDGQTTPTANIKLGGYKLVNVGNGTAATDAANLSLVQGGSTTYLAVTGTDTVVATALPTLTAYAAGQTFTFKAAGANTGAMTLNIDGLGAKAINYRGSVAIPSGTFATGQMIQVEYDGTQFQYIGSTAVIPNSTTNGVLYTNSSGIPINGSALTFNGTTLAVTGGLTTTTTVAATGAVTGDSLVIGSPTGGNKGSGSINTGSLYVNGSLVGAAALVLISTKSASASASLEWTGLTTYDKYLLVWENMKPATADDFLVCQVGTGAGPTYITSNYQYAGMEYGVSLNGTSPTVTAASAASWARVSSTGGTATDGSSGSVLITNMINTVGTTVAFMSKSSSKYDTSSDYIKYGDFGTVVANASVRTAIKIFFSVRNITSGSASLYGVAS